MTNGWDDDYFNSASGEFVGEEASVDWAGAPF
jgi:hypothetical protein